MLTNGKYIIRLDDASPAMNQSAWMCIERILDTFRIMPIVAVVPDNKDPDLVFGDPDPDFWIKVSAWQQKKWTIAMHGYSHQLEERKREAILPYHKKSEFCGLSYEAQVEKIEKAKYIFDRNGIDVRVWIAPAHGFDSVSLEVLKNTIDSVIISDGIALKPYYENGIFWIPQQLWKFRWMPFGVWTVCLHPNTMNEEALDHFAEDLKRYKDRIISISDIESWMRNRSVADRVACCMYWISRGKIVAAFS